MGDGWVMCCCSHPQVSPAEKNSSETLCSLKFAERVRSVELGPVSRKAELVSWPSQEQLEVPTAQPASFIVCHSQRHELTRGRAPSLPRVTFRDPPAGATHPPAPGCPAAAAPPSVGSCRPQVGGGMRVPLCAPRMPNPWPSIRGSSQPTDRQSCVWSELCCNRLINHWLIGCQEPS